MPPFRGSDQTLNREIETLESIARLRVRRVAHELRDLQRELDDLKRERARRRAAAHVPGSEQTTQPVES